MNGLEMEYIGQNSTAKKFLKKEASHIFIANLEKLHGMENNPEFRRGRQ